MIVRDKDHHCPLFIILALDDPVVNVPGQAGGDAGSGTGLMRPTSAGPSRSFVLRCLKTHPLVPRLPQLQEAIDSQLRGEVLEPSSLGVVVNSSPSAAWSVLSR